MIVYGLESDDLKILGDKEAVKFFRKLLWAEANRIDIGRHLISVSDAINVSDGGLDACIDNNSTHHSTFIPKGLSGFQIKTSNLGPKACKEELHEKGDLAEPLKPKIEWLLENGGTYFLILFIETSDTYVDKKREAIIEDLKEYGFEDPKVEVYVINKLLGLAERFPSIIAYLKPEILQGYSYEQWETREEVAKPNFVSSSERERIILDIQDKIRNSDKTFITRLIGLPGIGKTRLVFESLNPPDIKSKVVYADAETFKNSPLSIELETDENLEAILVLDECSPQTHDDLVRRFSNKGSRLSLISISHEMTNIPAPTLVHELDPLSTEDIKNIISEEANGLPTAVVDKIADFSSGYPRIALILVKNYNSSTVSSRDDILTLTDENLINRLIAGNMDPSSSEFKLTKKVLTVVALFQKVGYKGDLAQESKWLAEYFDIDYQEFRLIISNNKKRGIIQGEYYIYVTPAVLAINLTSEWFEIYGDSFDLTEFITSMPNNIRSEMVTSFTSRFPYITSIASGRKLVKNLLSKDGIYASGEFIKTDFGANLFLKLTEADAGAALSCLKNTVGTWNKEELLEFKSGRREVVWALEKIVIWKEHFKDATKLLFALGEAENEPYGNNASSIFAELFSPAPGRTSTTEASLENRFEILIESINSKSVERKKLALNAFDHALESRNFNRLIGAEYQGLKDLPQLWTPKNSEEVFNYYQKVWNYLDEHLMSFEEEIQKKAIKVILKRAREIANINASLSRMVIKTILKIDNNSLAEKEETLNVVSQITYYDAKNMPKDLIEEWITLKNNLTGSGFFDLLNRFVGTDIFEDYLHDKDLNYDTKWVDSKIQKLALKAINEPDLLNSEYSWLTTNKAKRGYKFGQEIGKLDNNNVFTEKIIKEQKKAGPEGNTSFLGGYLRGVSEKNENFVENKLIELSQDNFFQICIPQLSWQSLFNDKIGVLILRLAENEVINVRSLEIFSYGKIITQLSSEVFSKWLNFLLNEKSHNGAIVALHLAFFYYLEIELPKDSTLELLLHPVFWQNPNKMSLDHMVVHYWKELAVKLIQQYPETEVSISKQLIRYFGDRNSLFISLDSEISKILLDSIKRNVIMWEIIKEYIGPPRDSRALHLTKWLRSFDVEEQKAILEFFDPEDIWKWVEEDLENRAWYLANFVPPDLRLPETEICLAREFLVRYGDREDVRRNFSANYSSFSTFTGSLLKYYEGIKNDLLNFKKNENNENVIQWIEEYLPLVDENIERATIFEEKQRFL